MTPLQKILGDILKRRINAELSKDSASQNFTEIDQSISIFLADGKLTMDQYAEFADMIPQGTLVTNQ